MNKTCPHCGKPWLPTRVVALLSVLKAGGRSRAELFKTGVFEDEVDIDGAARYLVDRKLVDFNFVKDERKHAVKQYFLTAEGVKMAEGLLFHA